MYVCVALLINSISAPDRFLFISEHQDPDIGKKLHEALDKWNKEHGKAAPQTLEFCLTLLTPALTVDEVRAYVYD